MADFNANAASAYFNAQVTKAAFNAKATLSASFVLDYAAANSDYGYPIFDVREMLMAEAAKGNFREVWEDFDARFVSYVYVVPF